jgi:hypothetical protein
MGSEEEMGRGRRDKWDKKEKRDGLVIIFPLKVYFILFIF